MASGDNRREKKSFTAFWNSGGEPDSESKSQSITEKTKKPHHGYRIRYSTVKEDKEVRQNSNDSLKMERKEKSFSSSHLHSSKQICEKRKTRIMSFKELSSLILKDPNEIVLTLNSPNSGFFKTLELDMLSRDLMACLLTAVGKCCQSTLRFYVNNFVNRLSSSKNFIFLFQLFITSFQKKVRNDKIHYEALQYAFDFLKYFQESQPASACDILSILIPVLKSTLDSKFIDSIALHDKLCSVLDALSNENDNFIKTYSTSECVKQSRNEKLQMQEPPEDFRSLPILPKISDIFDYMPFLRPNIVQGKYMGTDHYLDVQFRLLKEDYFRPLREGIIEYIELKNENKSQKCKNVRVYENVHIFSSEFAYCGFVHLAQFDIKEFRSVNWEFSKRFLTGSLLCLSCDDFKTFHFATVVKRDPKKLKKGELVIKFEDYNEEIMRFMPLTEFVMLETQAYFEGYRHNLSALQNVGDLPFSNYIINVQKTSKKPEYLNEDSTYDMRPLIMPFDSCILKKGNIDYSMQKKNPEIMQKLKNVAILHDYDSSWPKKDDLDLDDSQYQAMKAALTKEFVVIQGPPGTGKTYLGLRIVQVLLHNIDVWNNGEQKQLPFLIACYTNHALDQFLDGVLKFTKNIVRIGGRGKEDLAHYQLSYLREKTRLKKDIPGHIFSNSKHVSWVLGGLKDEIQGIQAVVALTATTVLSEEILKVHMDEKHYHSLKTQIDICKDKSLLHTSSDSNSCIHDWLGLNVLLTENRKDFCEGHVTVENLNEIAATSISQNGCFDSTESLCSENMEIQEAFDVEFIEALRDIDNEEYGNVFTLRQNEASKCELTEQGEWKTQGGKKRQKQYITKMLKMGAMTSLEVNAITDMWQLNLPNRWRLYRYWLDKFISGKQQEIVNLHHEIKKNIDLRNELRYAEDLHVLHSAVVVGMTTTGAAKYREILQTLNPRVIVFEEAAEIFESHIVTCLTPGTQHLILIGDHQQLKPSPIVYQLATKYSLDISLFERMVSNGIECHKLVVQHRMRPCIASLLVPQIYSNLENHVSVLQFDDIKGVTKNMYFLNHSFNELNENESHSKVNHHEASFLIEFCRYLILQNYVASQITILTTYSGQLFTLKKLASAYSLLNGVRITVVDNFQGEENDIILISFVRSNVDGNIGFLKTSNRVCVALSRAKKALYCIGNFYILSKKSELWRHIVHALEAKDAIGNTLTLKCQNHPQNCNTVSSSQDFRLVPEGGCTLPCEYRLECGHVCTFMCHPYDPLHENFQCKKKCEKILCSRDHTCPKLCSEKCGKCLTRVKKTIPICNHQADVPCSVEPRPNMCTFKCPKNLKCGHPCAKKCNAVCTVYCKWRVNIKSSCGHMVNIDCYRSTFEDKVLAACNWRCQKLLSCGHTCNGTCGQCFQGRLHVPCRSECKRILVCGHQCKEPCAKNCPPCNEMCDNQCVHSKCPKKCGVPCEPCREKCQWECKHKKCTKLCGELCDREPCDVACDKKLSCGHNCIGFCGEPCPQKCGVCDAEELKEIFFGMEDEEGAMFVELEDCKHIFEVKGINLWMQTESGKKGEIIMKSCPKCKIVIRKNHRFGNYIKSSLFNIEKVKNVVFGDAKGNEMKKLKLLNDINRHAFEPCMLAFSESLSKWIEEKNINKQDITRAENVINILMELSKVLSDPQLTFDRSFREITVNLPGSLIPFPVHFDFMENLITFIESTFQLVIHFLRTKYKVASNMQLQDLVCEIQRLKLMCSAFSYFIDNFEKIGNRSEWCKVFSDAVVCVIERQHFTKEKEMVFYEKIKDLKRLCGSAVINVSKTEKELILSAMNLTQGHWFQCPNGHVYCITECGGAMEVGKCNECGELIGGQSHTLRSDNRVATDMVN